MLIVNSIYPVDYNRMLPATCLFMWDEAAILPPLLESPEPGGGAANWGVPCPHLGNANPSHYSFF